MTQTIEQLRWLGNYLAADAESKGIGQGSEGARYCWSAASEIEQLRSRIAELEQFLGDTIDALSDADEYLDQNRCGWLGIRYFNQKIFQEYDKLRTTSRKVP